MLRAGLGQHLPQIERGEHGLSVCMTFDCGGPGARLLGDRDVASFDRPTRRSFIMEGRDSLDMNDSIGRNFNVACTCSRSGDLIGKIQTDPVPDRLPPFAIHLKTVLKRHAIQRTQVPFRSEKQQRRQQNSYMGSNRDQYTELTT